LFYWSDTRKSWKEYNQTNGEFRPFEGDDSEIELCFGIHDAMLSSAGYNDSEPISAYLASELMELLPANSEYNYKNGHRPTSLSVGKTWDENLYFVTYLDLGRDFTPIYQLDIHNVQDRIAARHDKNLSNALAKMLINLIEDGAFKL